MLSHTCVLGGLGGHLVARVEKLGKYVQQYCLVYGHHGEKGNPAIALQQLVLETVWMRECIEDEEAGYGEYEDVQDQHEYVQKHDCLI